MPYKDDIARREYQRVWSANRSSKAIEELNAYKLKQGCSDCGYAEHPAALEFDHVYGEKLSTISRLCGNSKKMWEEVAKCEVVCSNCHSIRTWQRRL